MNKLYTIPLFFLFAIGNGCNSVSCEESGFLRIAPREGAVKINDIYTDLSIHAKIAMSASGKKLAFDPSEFVMQPRIGDSLYKKKGNIEYTLITEDSIYIQKFDCEKRKAVMTYSSSR